MRILVIRNEEKSGEINKQTKVYTSLFELVTSIVLYNSKFLTVPSNSDA